MVTAINEVASYFERRDSRPIIAKGLEGCDHLEMDQLGNLYVTLYSSGSLLRIDPEKRHQMIIDGQFSRPTGIAFGRKEFNEYAVYIADYQTDQIFEVPVGNQGI